MASGAVTFAARELRGPDPRPVAADLLEANVEDLRITDGAVHVAGVPAISVSFADIAAHTADGEARSKRRGATTTAGRAGGPWRPMCAGSRSTSRPAL